MRRYKFNLILPFHFLGMGSRVDQTFLPRKDICHGIIVGCNQCGHHPGQTKLMRTDQSETGLSEQKENE
jgi:hypothetical protein